MSRTGSPKSEAGGFIYVVAFSNGTVKVGASARPRSRLAAHRADAAKFRLSVTDSWVSERLCDYQDREGVLIVEAHRLVGTPLLGRVSEYIHGAPYAEVVEIARQVAADEDFSAVDDEEVTDAMRKEMAELARKAVADWPPLTEDQRTKIRAAFRPDPPAPSTWRRDAA